MPATRPAWDRPVGNRPDDGWTSGGDRPGGDRPAGDRPDDGWPGGDRPDADRPGGNRPGGDRPAGDRPDDGWPGGDRPDADRPAGDRPDYGWPRGDRPRGDRPGGDRPGGDRSSTGRPTTSGTAAGGAATTWPADPYAGDRPGGDDGAHGWPAAAESPAGDGPDRGYREPSRAAAAAAGAAAARSGAPSFGTSTDDPLADDEPTTHLFDARERTVVDDAPTEAMPVVAPAAGGAAGPDGEAVADWRPPKQTNRLTTILIIALLVALGFLAGVFVGRAAAPNATGGEQPRPAATSGARPGALR
jgi:hypothetical protein